MKLFVTQGLAINVVASCAVSDQGYLFLSSIARGRCSFALRKLWISFRQILFREPFCVIEDMVLV